MASTFAAIPKRRIAMWKARKAGRTLVDIGREHGVSGGIVAKQCGYFEWDLYRIGKKYKLTLEQALRHAEDGKPVNPPPPNSEAEAKQQLRLAKQALKLADSIMEYCAGDAWERECTEKDRAKFNALYERLFPRKQGRA